jgi:hypothetical protein
VSRVFTELKKTGAIAEISLNKIRILNLKQYAA